MPWVPILVPDKDFFSIVTVLVKATFITLSLEPIPNVPGLQSLRCLRTLNLRRNALVTNGLPPEMFESEELNTLDLSHNNLTEVPEGICRAKSLLVLNLAFNNLEMVPSQLFMSCTDLLHLDLSNNALEQLPPQLRRLTNLQTLALNNNPLSHFQVRLMLPQ